jgi:hypothetical protein
VVEEPAPEPPEAVEAPVAEEAPVAVEAPVAAPFDGIWQDGTGITITIAGSAVTVKDGDVVIAKGSIAVSGDTATATSTQIADENDILVDAVESADLTLAAGQITTIVDGETYTFTK